MKAPRRLASYAWRRMSWRLLASYLFVCIMAIGALGAVGGLLTFRYFNTNLTVPNPDEFRRSLVQGTLLAAAVAVVASVVVSWFVSRRIVEPLRQMMEASQRIAAGRYAERVPISGDDFEVTQLAATFNRMASALQQTEERRQALIADVAHELRTPLTTIKGYMEALMDEVMPADQETYQLIYQEADRLYRLVRDLQELSRLEAGQMGLAREPVAIADLVQGVLGRVRPQFQRKSVQLACNVAPDTGYALGDADRLYQVMLNLLSNALQYTPVGGRVDVTAYNERERVCVAVRDNGIGISPEHLGQIFGRFYRVDKSRSRIGGGTGIGLTIVKHIVEAHGGTIAASSLPGLGSTFTLSLPLYRAVEHHPARIDALTAGMR